MQRAWRSFFRSVWRRVRPDCGMTVAELTIAMGLFAIVVTAVVSVMNVAQSNLQKEISRAQSNDQLRLAAQAIDREVRSGEVLYDPSQENYSAGDVTPGMSMRIYTESNYTSRGGQPWCVQWRITSGKELQQRRWVTNWSNLNDSSQYVGWRTVATGVTNRSEGIAAFTRPSGVLNLINIRLRDNNDSTKGTTVEVKQSISGRNTQGNQSTSICGGATPTPSAGGVPAY